jgi:PAS domain S-box-containing protein
MLNRWLLTDRFPGALCVACGQETSVLVLAFLVAAIAAYTAFRMAGRVRDARDGGMRLIWLAAAGLTMGAGIWSMHFIALLAIEIPTPVRFNLPASVLSAALAVVTATLAFHVIGDPSGRRIRSIIAGVILGCGIGLMHYVGMAALRMPGDIHYEPWLFAASLGVAVVLSTAALLLLTALARYDRRGVPLGRIASAIVMGLAIVLTHATGMAAAWFQPDAAGGQTGVLAPPFMVAAAAFGTVMIAAIAVIATLFDLRAETLLSDAVNSFVAGFVIYDADDRLVLCNDAYRQMFPKKAPAMMRGARFEDILRHGVAQGQFRICGNDPSGWIAERLREHREANHETEVQLADGSWVLMSDRRMRNGGIAGLRTDITALKAAQAALRASEARLDRAQEMAGIGSWELDVRTGERIWSKEMYRIRGIMGADQDPTLRGLERFTHNEDRNRFRDWLDRLLAGDAPGPIEYRIRRPDGQLRTVRAEGRGLADTTGAIVTVEGTLRDVTEQRRTEELLQQAQKMETVGQLTGGLAHDFNNILSAVIGNLDLASARLPPGAQASGYCKLALDAALSGAELVKRLLAFSRRQPLRPVPIQVDGAIAGIMPMVRRTLGEPIRVDVRSAPLLWPALADTAQLESAILNLVVNARDAMPQGGTLTIEAENLTIESEQTTAAGKLAAGDYVMMAVHDTGTGMTREQLARAFEPFFTTKPPGSGSGLGLSMVFGTMQQLGGSVDITSEIGVGTTVRLYLPRAGGERERPRPHRVAPAPDPTGDERILMVEDNAGIRDVGSEMLTRLGYEVIVVASGDEAMQRVRDGLRFDLLFTDVVMPGTLDGIALAQALRARDPSVRVVFTSGFANPEALEQRSHIPGSELLPKPYRQSDLARMVRSVLNRLPEGTA